MQVNSFHRYNKLFFRLGGILFVLQIVFVQPVCAQLPNEELKNKSDYLFAEGVEKFHSKQYDEAIPLFRECAYIDSLIYDANSSRLGYASIWLACCHFALGDVETAKYISDYYMVKPIDRRLTVKSDSISDLLFPILYEKGDGESVLPLIREVLLLEQDEIGEHNVWIGNTYSIYGYALLLSGHTDEAIDAYKQSLTIIGTLCGHKSKPYAYVLSDMINAYSAKGDYHSAYSDACELLDIYKTENLSDSNILYTAIATCGDYLLTHGKYQESIPFLSESLDILSNMDFENSSDYAITLAGLGRAQLLTGERKKAKETLERSYSLLMQISAPYDKRYLIQCMDCLSQANFVEGDTLASINLNKEAITLFESENLEKNYLYPELYFNLWNIFESLRRSKDAHLFAEKAIENYRLLDCKDMNYASLLFRYSECVAKENHYKYAIQLASEALSFVENVPDIPDSVLIMYRSQLASQYSDNGDMDSAYYYAQAALRDINFKFSRQSLNYIHCLSKIASVLWFSGKREDAMELYQEAVDQVSTSYSGSESHFRILNDFANICQLSGLYTKAVDIQKEAVRIAENLYGKGSEAYSESTAKLLQYSSVTNDVIELQSMIDDINVSEQAEMTLQNVRQQVVFAFRQGDISKAESLITEACQVMGKESNGMSSEYASLLMLQAELYNSIGKPSEALSSLEKFYTIATGLWGKDKFEKYYFNYWNLLGIANANLKRWDEAEKALCNSISAAKTLFGENHMEYLLPQAVLAAVKNQKGDAEGAANMMSTLFNSLREQIFIQFATMSSKERSAFWSQVASIFNPGMPFFAYNSHNFKYYGDGYNALLLSKGLLLNTEQEINQLLINSNDEKGLELYNNLLALQQRLNSLQVAATPKSLSEADSLREAIRRGERELIAISSAYGDYTRNLRFSWQDVKGSLKTNDIAIEFADFYDQDGNNLYVAFVLSRDMEVPQIVRLFDYSDYSRLNSAEYYTSESLYNLIWKPLESFFSKDSRIFFSPQGVLNSIALESLPSSKGIPISNSYSVYRLSSTKELCMGKSLNNEKTAVLYGDIDYDADNELKSNHTKDNHSSSHERNKDMAQIRGAITDELLPLPGTKMEVDSIANSFIQADRLVRVFTKAMATESSVGSLSSSDYTILHIATHGYYLSSSSSESEGSFLNILNRNSFAENQEDLSLLRSGLFFAGANTTLSGDMIMNSGNDGILTAKEVANIDLNTFEMVSLSACQTGLGDVSGDGVFGIQRGFKKAGVKSLLMSLWNVDDKATCALMTEFYRCWLGGLSKYDALESAKSMVRSVEGWEDPKYWAAFILLDGVN